MEKLQEMKTKPNCKDCPLNGHQQVLGGGICILKGTEEQEKSTNPKVLLQLVEAGPSTKTTYSVVMAGMAPAREELAKGEVFVGISGQILKALLVRLGYTEAYLCNCLQCEIPGDWIENDPRRQLAIECCRERFLDEISSASPRLIVAMGAMPLEELIGAYSIVKVAGRVFPTEVTKYKIAPVLPTLHPAYVWRWPEVFYDLVDQMRAGVKWLDGTYQSAVEPQVIIATRENIDSILDLLEQANIGSLDLETTGGGFYPYGNDPDQIRCLIFAVDNKTSYIIPAFHCGKDNPYWDNWGGEEIEYENLLVAPDIYPRLKKLIEEGTWRLHNGQFDAGFLLQVGILVTIFFDSMLAHYTIDEREYAHGLKKIAGGSLGAPDWEEDIRLYTTKKKDSYDKIPNSKLFWYGAHDGIYTNQISEGLEEDTKDTWFLHQILLPAANMFNELRHRGIRVNPKELMSLDETLELEVSQADDELAILAGEPVNANSPQEVMELLYDKLKYPLPYGHKGRMRTSNKKALASFLPDPLIEKIIDCRHFSKLKNTYVESLAKFIGEDVKLHPFTRLMAAVTGRLATEDPSVMNISKTGGIMRIYIPEFGHKFGVFDYKGMELRVGALVTEDRHLIEILWDPERDPHRECATEAYGADLAAQMRGRIKTVVFGRFYGRGRDSVQRALRLTNDETDHLVDTVDGFFPNLPVYQEKTRREIHEKGYLVSMFGRYRRFGLLTRSNISEIYRQGYNFKVQSPASDIPLMVMLRLYEIREETRAVPLWPIHDSIIFDMESEDCVPVIKDHMERIAQELVDGKMRFPVDVKVGDNWGDAQIWKEEGE